MKGASKVLLSIRRTSANSQGQVHLAFDFSPLEARNKKTCLNPSCRVYLILHEQAISCHLRLQVGFDHPTNYGGTVVTLRHKEQYSAYRKSFTNTSSFSLKQTSMIPSRIATPAIPTNAPTVPSPPTLTTPCLP